MRSKRILGESGRLSYRFVFLFLLFACMALAGCSKNCADYEKKLNAYADGSKPIDDVAKVQNECKEALAKCPDLAVAFEVMGDIDAKFEKLEEADKNYEKALALKSDNERVSAKKNRISEALSEAKARTDAAKFESIKRMQLREYARLEDSMRMAWCEKAINSPLEYVFLDHSPFSTFDPKFSGTAGDLDRLLIGLAEKNPTWPTWRAASMLFTVTGRGQ